MRKILFILLAISLNTFAQNIPDFALVGFGEKATGGKGGRAVHVNNYTDLKKYAESDDPMTIFVSGTIQNGADGGSISVHSNKTILGAGNSTLLYGVGLTIGDDYHNIIIRNIRATMTGVKTKVDKKGVYSSTGDEGRAQVLTNGGDCIRLNGHSYDVWIDHCELFNEDPDVQTNIDLYDGLIDFGHGCHNITISWNYVHDHHKTHLVGSSERDTSDRKITFHHNYFKHCKDRLPLYRSGVGHIFNNYYLDCKNSINSRIKACVYVERNYFENVYGYTVTSISSKILGYATLVDNLFINSKEPAIGTCSSFNPSDYYSYRRVLNKVHDVKAIVTQWAGVGKL